MLDDRAVLGAILWRLRAGSTWSDIPARVPSYQTCQRRFENWLRAGIINSIIERISVYLRDRGGPDLTHFVAIATAPTEQEIVTILRKSSPLRKLRPELINLTQVLVSERTYRALARGNKLNPDRTHAIRGTAT